MSDVGGAPPVDPSSHASSGSSDDGLDTALDAFLDWAEEKLDQRGATALGPGRTLGDFELIAPLGSGGMGVVWEAAQISVPGRIVAVKILRAELVGVDAAERFRREVEAIGRLDHRAIVPVVSAGVADGAPYYAMKSVAGSNLAQLLRRLRESGDVPRDASDARRHVLAAAGTASSASDLASDGWQGSWTAWCAHLVLELADALQHAHEQGVVHRDVKPANVLVTPAGHPVLVDFGLASTDASTELTVAGDFIGTLAYAAPEQVLGQSVDTRADVWGLGAVLYELLTLSRPFDAPDRAALIEQLDRGELPDPGPLAPGDLHTVVTTALARDRSRRYATPGDLAHDLRAWLGGRPIRARPPGLVRRTVELARRHPRTLVSALTLLAVFAVGEGRDHWRAAGLVGEADLARQRAKALDSELRRLDARIAGLLHPGGLRAARALDTRPLGKLRVERGQRVDERDLERGRAESLYLDALATSGTHQGARDGLALLTRDARADALQAALDLRRPEEFDALDERQRRLAKQGAPVSPPDPGGVFGVTTSPAGAQVSVYAEGRDAALAADGAAPLVSGLTPLDARLPRGSYRARIELAGHAPVVVPFVVRPADAAWPDGEPAPETETQVVAAGAGVAPWARLDVTLHENARVPDGWVHVPGGWSLVGQPPRWRHVDDVITQLHEVTYADWLGFLGSEYAAADSGVQAVLPRFLDQPHFMRDEQGQWQYDTDVVHDPRWPVRGLSRTDAYEYLLWLARRPGFEPPGWVLDLPTELEWERMARGADGRAYPWGDEFRWDACAFSWSRDDPQAEHWPVPVQRFADDVSVFGVHDLAGSIAELTRSSFGPARDSVAVRGGSYLSGEIDTLTTWARREEHNAAVSDVGFRLVQRRAPAWLVAPPPAPGPFADDFERPESETVGNGWIEGAGSPLRATSDGGAVEQVSLLRGRMLLQGGQDNFSEPSTAWHAFTPPPGPYVLEARLRVTARDEAPSRGAQLSLVDERLRLHCALDVFPDGRVGLSQTQAPTPRKLDGEADARAGLVGHWLDVELRVEPPWLRARVRVAGSSATDVELECALPERPDVRFLRVEAGNFDGVLIELERVELRGSR